jgi:hypothetical protein
MDDNLVKSDVKKCQQESRYNFIFGRRVLVDGAYFLALASASLFSGCRWGRACASTQKSLDASL